MIVRERERVRVRDKEKKRERGKERQSTALYMLNHPESYVLTISQVVREFVCVFV